MDVVSADNNSNCVTRRTANYKSNIWNYDNLQLLTNKYNDAEYIREAEILKDEVCGSLKEYPLTYKLEFIDVINKLSLSHYFEEEVNQTLYHIACMDSISNDDPYYTALFFRLLRQHGYHVSQDSVLRLLDEEEKLIVTENSNEKAMVEIFEASYLALENECFLDDQWQKIYSDKCPLHWSVNWFITKKYMYPNNKSILHRLARLSFNLVQFQHQKDLKDILRWWRNLGLSNVLTFTRDRVVESFLWAVGVAYEPQYGSLRKWLTKAIMLVLIIDDVYDIYGSIHELEQFTTAVERWDPSQVEHLPEAIKTCFSVLYNTANDIDLEVQKGNKCNSILPALKEVWIGFCKALLVEARCYHMGQSQSFGEYLDNGWISSSGPVISLHVLLGLGQDMDHTMAVFNSNQEIIRHVSLIIRLCNDQGTSKDEIKRGDAASSILCYMREANVSEEEARVHIRNIISKSWKKINGLFIKCLNPEKPMVRYIVNVARVANFIYQHGDGFGVQDRETRDQVLSCLIEPVPLN